jgi:hypothetical protein
VHSNLLKMHITSRGHYVIIITNNWLVTGLSVKRSQIGPRLIGVLWFSESIPQCSIHPPSMWLRPCGPLHWMACYDHSIYFLVVASYTYTYDHFQGPPQSHQAQSTTPIDWLHWLTYLK